MLYAGREGAARSHPPGGWPRRTGRDRRRGRRRGDPALAGREGDGEDIELTVEEVGEDHLCLASPRGVEFHATGEMPTDPVRRRYARFVRRGPAKEHGLTVGIDWGADVRLKSESSPGFS